MASNIEIEQLLRVLDQAYERRRERLRPDA